MAGIQPVTDRTHRRAGDVLGVSLDLLDYESAWKRILGFVEEKQPRLVAAANTHLVGEAVEDPSFAKVLKDFDMVLPDGMPLVWSLRLDGYSINDRVYGPYFMRYALVNSEQNLKHYFFGGSEECLKLLCERAREMNPAVQIVGAVSPPYRAWDANTEEQLIADINAARPDIVWVALGGVKQETWLFKNKSRFSQGVFAAVGDAFVLNAGMRSYAPAWMQKMSLTWLFRLWQEPKRLASRYLKYNTRFAFAYLKERLIKAWS